MTLNNLSPVMPNKDRKRIGRGHGSGWGKTAARGHKGQGARSGGLPRPSFEGGQLPLFMKIPKRGFKCRNSKHIITINVAMLDVFNEGDTVDVAALQAKGLVSNPRDGVKILGNGEIAKKLTVKANYFSESAKEKIEKAGGKTEVI